MAGEEVSIWMCDDTLKVEYQTTALSEYTLRFSPDHQSIEAVKQPKRLETQFVSPQLRLWQRGEAEWLLTLRQPERHKRTSKRSPANIVQLRLAPTEVWGTDAPGSVS